MQYQAAVSTVFCILHLCLFWSARGDSFSDSVLLQGVVQIKNHGRNRGFLTV